MKAYDVTIIRITPKGREILVELEVLADSPHEAKLYVKRHAPWIKMVHRWRGHIDTRLTRMTVKKISTTCGDCQQDTSGSTVHHCERGRPAPESPYRKAP